MNEELRLDVEVVTENESYSDTASYEVVKLMMEADVVTIGKMSIEVREIEVTDMGLVRFHGNAREM